MKVRFPVFALLVFSTYACHCSATKNEKAEAQPTQTSTVNKVEQAGEKEAEARNKRVESPPEAFKGIDFQNFTYPYPASGGRMRNIALEGGHDEFDFNGGGEWFDFINAYYVDLTHDREPEAIVLLWHWSCGVSCDGGATLCYVYTVQRNRLSLLWRYETGSLGYGCGLKSFTVKDREISMELFGRCFAQREESLVGKFQIKDTTRLTFSFSGGKLVEEKKEFIAVPERDVGNYKADISINE